MNVEEFRIDCLSLKEAEENAPWTEAKYRNLITFSVGKKWFAILDPDNKFANVKCNPEIVTELIDRYTGCFPAWHMNKTHWIGMRLESDVPDNVIKELLTASYQLIVASLSRRVRDELGLTAMMPC